MKNDKIQSHDNLSEEKKQKAAERLTDIVMAYDFYAAKETVSDVRYMVEELNEYHYDAFTSKEKQERLKTYFSGLRETSDTEDAKLAFTDALNVVDKISAATLEQSEGKKER
ncbi:MAG: hypothetical protein WC260_03400 [Candidatus Pacearchaeota archaeon]